MGPRNKRRASPGAGLSCCPRVPGRGKCRRPGQGGGGRLGGCAKTWQEGAGSGRGVTVELDRIQVLSREAWN